ncbi:MAG: dehypoxanthine futalosine cyclase [Nitrospirae bacterium CG_4_9_14_3_um_filter_53_35]|nr:MAG: dehypoxanthine futalosine cyclase [Nitrospirae bacterium CG2_30_53_67]PIV83335.1 MAG: dehypoxanthine futalosine cyclase [Nitrospirae bacterium CG17_big_fil_post_rev_8_21_14_2_50_50_9]PIW85015.1 MAG: dehypoxanthine futalosine cyclase [Nitrospirae bacterium CG_4_8_14_3_um_filter_50_41]PIX85052.1 MAG: dehypoxanthine futalosine cyclase [Nitrospirae bacterium CG_4_10_14_3_um_filter_53_41]PJA77106.1 MAG: dehypoxanthine futalosine cyclase [Nitrospirae bacterium CG_4_9_14_3_um_filter_53_35]
MNLNTTNAIEEKIREEKRLTQEEGLFLLEKADLLTLGEWAQRSRRRKHPDQTVTFIIDRNINYTNICINRCRFCAFYRSKGDPDAYLLSREETFRKIQETLNLGGTQILMQGGLHPDLSIEYFEELFHEIKTRYPIHIHALSPPEIVHLSRQSDLSIRDVLTRLKASGLDSIPGGGAEILVDRVRSRISPNKISQKIWLDVMREAHGLGIPASATMMFGSIEEPEDVIQHLIRIRDLQDETGGFTAFIPWSYQPGNTELGGETVTGVEYLRVLSISRLLLDNIDNIQASWVTQGAKMGQAALFFGANDFGSTMIEENVVSATGVSYRMSAEEIIRLIRDAGFQAAQRNTTYQILKRF